MILNTKAKYQACKKTFYGYTRPPNYFFNHYIVSDLFYHILILQVKVLP